VRWCALIVTTSELMPDIWQVLTNQTSSGCGVGVWLRLLPHTQIHKGAKLQIKGYRQYTRRVQNPMRPGTWANEAHLVPSGASFVSQDGHDYEADEDGWFTIPQELGEFLRSGAYPGGERFLTRYEAREQHKVGFLDDDFSERPAPVAAPAKPVAKRTTKTTS
jgi:hypothetical protein